MTYELSQHARDVIAERQIEIEWIERVLDHPQRNEPDRFDPELRHHLGKIPEFEDRVLRVVFNPSAYPLRIITVYFDRAMKGKL